MTDKISVFSLEVGDTIRLNKSLYVITAIEDGDEREYRLILVDEWGMKKHVEADGVDKMTVFVEEFLDR